MFMPLINVLQHIKLKIKFTLQSFIQMGTGKKVKTAIEMLKVLSLLFPSKLFESS